jgi:putative transposase
MPILNVLIVHIDKKCYLEEVRETTYWWMISYNEERPHDSLGDLTPAEYMELNAANSTLKVSI